jgi:hypothetical protein
MGEKQALFEAKGRTLLSQGWKVLADQEDGPDEGSEEGEKEPFNPVPAMKPGTKAMTLTGTVTTKKTKPASRFTEASLIRELEKRGIWPSVHLRGDHRHHFQPEIRHHGKTLSCANTPWRKNCLRPLRTFFL